ncbi:hypothetical protein B0I37DRAFT_392998 [Chaetomium sp. MPI-CAGE-AT-0009]|nr:hypothetical protein B0I37DRAFT_392998 [Chaetomium sp. MPI-CAGE-AT-0009]
MVFITLIAITSSSLLQRTSTSTSTPTFGLFQIRIPEASIADNAPLVTRLTNLINTAYTITEKGLFAPTYRRTSEDEVRELLRQRQFALAFTTSPSNSADVSTASSPDSLIGCIRILDLSPTHGDFGMLACVPAFHGAGTGRALVRFAEEHCRAALGKTVMQCELLVSLEFEHPFKARNQAWYERMGYRVVRTADFAVEQPHLAPHLITKAELRVFEKRL